MLRNVIDSMVIQDSDSVLNLDDLQDEDNLKRFIAVAPRAGNGSGLVGRPLSEIERFYIEKTLELTEGNREEAARVLGIGERTLYRVIQDWKLRDKVKAALDEAGGDVAQAAKSLKAKPDSLQRKLKKWGWPA